MTNDFKDTPWGIVYYLYDPKRDLIKIGTTKNLKERMWSHRRFYGRLHILGIEPGSYTTEREIHARWDGYRKRVWRGAPSEWFHCNDELLDHIQKWTMRHDTYLLLLDYAHKNHLYFWDVINLAYDSLEKMIEADPVGALESFQKWHSEEYIKEQSA